MNPVDRLNMELGIGPKRPNIPRDLVVKGYKSIRQVGKGAFGAAILVFNEKRQEYSIAKEVVLAGMGDGQKKEAENEVDILSGLHHPNIIRYGECHVSRDRIVIVMEYADGGDLCGKIKAKAAMGARFRPAEAARLFSQTALAIKYLHDRHILHRDLKPQNVFLTSQGVVKLGDFGISTVLQSSVMMAKTICGTPFYFSPELCEGKAYNNKSDVWALGCVLFEILTLDVPFPIAGGKMTDLMNRIVNDDPVIPAYVDGGWERLLRAMLHKDCAARPNIDDVCRDEYLNEQFCLLAAEFERQAADIEKSETIKARRRSSAANSPAGSPRPDAPDAQPREVVAGRRSSRPSGGGGGGGPPAIDASALDTTVEPQFGRRSPKAIDSLQVHKNKLAKDARAREDQGLRSALDGLDRAISFETDGSKRRASPSQSPSPPQPQQPEDAEDAPLPKQPPNPSQEQAECRNMVEFIKSVQSLQLTKLDLKEKKGKPWGDDWCSGFDLTSPDVCDDDAGGLRVGGDTISWTRPDRLDDAQDDGGGALDDDECGARRLASATSTSEVRLAASQALLSTLEADFREEKALSKKLKQRCAELEKQNTALVEENKRLKRAQR